MAKIRVLALNVNNAPGCKSGLHETYVDDNNLNSFYKELGCDCFDVTARIIGGITYDIYCDDIGLFRDNIIPSAFDDDMRPVLVGNLIFAHHDSAGNSTGLSEEDITNIEKHAIFIRGGEHKTPWTAIAGVIQ